MDLSWLMKEAQAGEHLELVLLSMGGYRDLREGELPSGALEAAERWLRDRGLAGEENLGTPFRLTYDGRVLAEALHRSRTSGERRWDLVMRAMIEAIYRQEDPEEIQEVDRAPVTRQEREVVYCRMEKWQLAKLLRSWGGQVLRFIPKPAMAEALGVVGSLNDHFEGQGYMDYSVTNTTHVSGGTVGGVMTGGTQNTMHVRQTISPLELTGINAKVDEILALLTDANGNVDELVDAVEAIREEAALPGSTKSSVKEKVVDGIAVAGDLAGIAQMAPVIADALPKLAQLVTMLAG